MNDYEEPSQAQRANMKMDHISGHSRDSNPLLQSKYNAVAFHCQVRRLVGLRRLKG
jgi:hypothetical protein